ncbi:DUF4145 domain-containing protein [Brucella anthropi]|uniref:DUF4145 domain-containing protein n=1 Tax=Brucella anthropi TaxID=529 RepID=UPI00124DE310|nr:DUF4145 domain-containing protein [Brucella anthropi]KAB2758000.1 DUF4145 domain-containing protein [Brucella anthropi]
MGQLVATCPHCHAVDIALDVFAAKAIKQLPQNGRWYAVGGAVCRRCHHPIGVSIFAEADTFVSIDQYENALGDLFDDPVVTLEDIGCDGYVVYTPSPEPDTPGHLSAAVLKAYSTAEKNLRMEGCEDAAAVMYRRAIETAIKEKYPDLKGDLIKRIDKLQTDNLIPEAMKDWAHEIRIVGNGGAHDIDGVTREEIVAARGFADAFLRYLISLPEEVRRRRDIRELA